MSEPDPEEKTLAIPADAPYEPSDVGAEFQGELVDYAEPAPLEPKIKRVF